MSYSNRPSKRPDPTVAPVEYDPVTGEASMRMPFTPSEYFEKRRQAAAEARKRNRQGYRP